MTFAGTTYATKLRTMKRILTLCLLCLGAAAASAQDTAPQDTAQDTAAVPPVRPVTNVLAVQAGNAQIRDTYLTPQLYEGAALGVQYERWRVMRHSRLTNRQQAGVDFARGTDRYGHSEQWAGRMDYSYALHWTVARSASLRASAVPTAGAWSLMLGPYAGAALGFDYNLKLASSNNPATLRLAGDVGASAMATCYYRIRRQAVPVQLYVQWPLVGEAFVPEYGASYYETFYLDHTDGDMRFTSFHNRHDVDVRLTTDLPLYAIFRRFLTRCDCTLRLGVALHHEAMRQNDILTRYTAVQGVVGLVFQQIPFSRKRAGMLRDAYRPAF